MPVFITHFIEHNNGDSFFEEMKEFLVHHYGGHEIDADWETDQKLPFMKIDFHQVDLFYTPVKLTYLDVINHSIISAILPLINDSHWYSRDLESLWQPPKKA